MRMRKLKWAPDFLDNSPLVIANPSELKGKWKEKFGNNKSLHIEIGTGKGDYWIGMAQRYPNITWIGIEKDMSVAALAVRKATPLNLNNVAFICADAQTIEEWFETKEIDVIHLNFSDPWPKKRNHKRRLSHNSFVTKYKDLIKANGEIQMKTDNKDLFEFSLIQMQDCGLHMNEVSVDFRRNIHDEDTISEYESKFMENGQPIYRAVWDLEGIKHEKI
ncbi:MAG: tRNA (guanosine(46)-N7)-methyltransferase TrmB [Erysipelotrichaceae bacterium]